MFRHNYARTSNRKPLQNSARAVGEQSTYLINRSAASESNIPTPLTDWQTSMIKWRGIPCKKCGAPKTYEEIVNNSGAINMVRPVITSV
jgi:hypothetical protein